MDPCTVLGAVSSALSIVTLIGSTVKQLSELRGRYVEADQSIRSVVTQLSTIKSALSIIHEWAENDLVVSPKQADLVGALSVAMDGCKEAMGALAEEVEGMVGKSMPTDTLGFKARTKYIWNENAMKEHQGRLQSQVMVLQFLVVAVQSRSPQERTEILNDTNNQVVIQKVVDDTSTLRASIRSSVAISGAPPTIASHTDSTIDSRSYAVDAVIVGTGPYERVRQYRLAVGKNRPVSDMQGRNNVENQRMGTQHPIVHKRSRSDMYHPYEDEGYETKSPNNTDASSEQYPSAVLPNGPAAHRKPQFILPYEASVNSEPVNVYRSRNTGSEHHTSHAESVSRNIDQIKTTDQDKKLSWFRFRRKDKTVIRLLSPTSGTTSPVPESRRGRRGFENFFYSIDFSSSNSLTVPPLVRAAQAGSISEVEKLFDRGSDIEDRHASTGRSALAVAAHCGNDDVVSLLLQYGAATNVRDTSKSTPLHLAASRGHIGSMRLLLQEGALVEEKDSKDRSPLWLASSNGYVEAVELLLAYKAKVNARAYDQLTSLHVAAKRGDAAMIDLLLRHGAHVDAKDGLFMAALHYACEGGHETAASTLIAKRANINAPGTGSKTPLICAAATGHLHIIELLLRRKATIKSKADNGMNALHWASQSGHVEIVDFLIAKKVPVNVLNADGNTPLHLAIIAKKFDVVELLLRRRADLEARCNQSYTALHYGCALGTPDIIDILLGYGAQLEAMTIERGRPLHIATTHGALRTVELLLARGANHEARDIVEDRALTLACLHGHVEIVEAFLNAGAPLRSRLSDRPWSHEDSPLCVAARYGHRDVCSLLIARGASVLQKDERPWQPLRYGAYYGHPDVVRLLLSHGATVSSVGASGDSGFDITASRIGFATTEVISQKRKDEVMLLLHNAEEVELATKAREASGELDDSTPSTMQLVPPELTSYYSTHLPPPIPRPSITNRLQNSDSMGSGDSKEEHSAHSVSPYTTGGSYVPTYHEMPTNLPPRELDVGRPERKPVPSTETGLDRRQQIKKDQEAVQRYRLVEEARVKKLREEEERAGGVSGGGILSGTGDRSWMSTETDVSEMEENDYIYGDKKAKESSRERIDSEAKPIEVDEKVVSRARVV